MKTAWWDRRKENEKATPTTTTASVELKWKHFCEWWVCVYLPLFSFFHTRCHCYIGGDIVCNRERTITETHKHQFFFSFYLSASILCLRRLPLGLYISDMAETKNQIHSEMIELFFRFVFVEHINGVRAYLRVQIEIDRIFVVVVYSIIRCSRFDWMSWPRYVKLIAFPPSHLNVVYQTDIFLKLHFPPCVSVTKVSWFFLSTCNRVIITKVIWQWRINLFENCKWENEWKMILIDKYSVMCNINEKSFIH